MNKKSEDRGSERGSEHREERHRDKENRGQGRGEGGGRHSGETRQERGFGAMDDQQQVQAENVQDFEAAAYEQQQVRQERGREERDRQRGKGDDREQFEAPQLTEAPKKSGCLPKVAMLLMSFAAVGAAVFLRS